MAPPAILTHPRRLLEHRLVGEHGCDEGRGFAAAFWRGLVWAVCVSQFLSSPYPLGTGPPPLPGHAPG